MNLIESLIPASDIKGLIFDLDGTLADTMPLHIDAWRATGKLYGVEITAQMVEERAGTPTIQVIQQLNKLYNWDINPSSFREKKNVVYLDLKKKHGKVQPVQRVVDVARSYRGKLPMAIGTGSIRYNASLAVQDLAIGDWFEAMYTADDVDHPKPHPETFIKCAEHIKVEPKDCMVYEDGPPGITAALAAGMTVVNVDTFELYRP